MTEDVGLYVIVVPQGVDIQISRIEGEKRDADAAIDTDMSDFVKAAQSAVREVINDEDPGVKEEESNLVAHARRELKLIGEDDHTIDGFLKVVQAWADMGHSGGSHSVCLPMLVELLNFKNLSPLTDDPDEWMHHTAEVWGEPGGVWQNVRNGEAFSNDGGKTYTLLSDRQKSKKGKKRKPIPIYTSQPHNEEAKPDSIKELCDAIRLTVEYIGTDKLPPIPGWSWYDALCKYAPEMVDRFEPRGRIVDLGNQIHHITFNQMPTPR